MPSFKEIASSVSRYTAAVLGAMLKQKSVEELKANDDIVTDCLKSVWVELSQTGLTIDIHKSIPKKAYNVLVNNFLTIQLYTRNEPTLRPNHSTRFVISHLQVFKLLMSLGFDFRDVFDMYEAARIREQDPLLINADGTQTTTLCFEIYRALAALTKNIEELRRVIKFRETQFDNLLLGQASIGIQALWELVTKKIQTAKDLILAKRIIDLATI